MRGETKRGHGRLNGLFFSCSCYILGLVPTHCSAEHRFPRCLDHRYCAKYEGEASTYLFELAFSMVEVTLNGRSLTACVVLSVRACVCVRASGRGRGSTQFNERDKLLRVNGSTLDLPRGVVLFFFWWRDAKKVCFPISAHSCRKEGGVGRSLTAWVLHTTIARQQTRCRHVYHAVSKKKEERGAGKRGGGKWCRRDWVIGRWLCTSKEDHVYRSTYSFVVE